MFTEFAFPVFLNGHLIYHYIFIDNLHFFSMFMTMQLRKKIKVRYESDASGSEGSVSESDSGNSASASSSSNDNDSDSECSNSSSSDSSGDEHERQVRKRAASNSCTELVVKIQRSARKIDGTTALQNDLARLAHKIQVLASSATGV